MVEIHFFMPPQPALTSLRRFGLVIALMLLCFRGFALEQGECTPCGDCSPKVALKTNLLYDALAVPSLGAEIGFAGKYSVGLSGVWAWWSKGAKFRYWRIYGGRAEMRRWFGSASRKRALTGHHIGLYGSMHKYDFQLGGTGHQAPRLNYGVGLCYGYSFAVSGRLNIDVSLSAGYACGEVIKYRPQCGVNACVDHYFRRYIGPTSLEVSLVWFPGRGPRNNPDFTL